VYALSDRGVISDWIENPFFPWNFDSE
jgi:hypothetical protein